MSSMKEVVLIVMLGIFSVLIIILPGPERLEYVPGAIRGLTSLIGILAGFVGFCLTFAIGTTKNIEIKNRLRKRGWYILVFIMLGLAFAVAGYGDLVSGNLARAYKQVGIGLIIIAVLFGYTMVNILTPFDVEE